MVRLQLRSLVAAMPWLGLVLGACDPASPRDAHPHEDASVDDGAVLDDGDGGDAEPPMSTAGTGAPFPFPPIVIPTEGKYCALSVGAQCDGREDCPSGQRCCATFNPATVSYDNVSCQANCRGMTRCEVCHADGDGESDCADPGYVCRPSLIARFEFFSVCALRLPSDAKPTNTGTPGLIECGHDTRCEVGAEQCCLRASFDFARGTTSFLEPYCAPIEAGRAACDCSVEPPSSGAPQDAGVDASIGDASQPEPDDDAG